MSADTTVISDGFAYQAPRDARLPGLPRTVEETGLEFLFVVELVAKVLFSRGQASLATLVAHLKLAPAVLEPVLAFLRSERLAEVLRHGALDGDVAYQLTDAGRSRAAAWLERCSYAGVAPVSLRAYQEAIDLQSVVDLAVSRESMHAAFGDTVVRASVLDRIGAAMNSGRAIFLYGPAGAGKTYLAERLHRLLKGKIVVPHAVCVGGEIVQVFDPLVHRAIKEPEPTGAFERAALGDERWVRCARPVVVSGGELRLSMLDLDFDEGTRCYQVPPHIKANNGIYVVDDLGRQLVTPRDLMNRWVVPLDRRRDYLSLRTGHKFDVPFDVIVVFSTNLKPADLVDEAFLRRIGYKIYLGPLTEPEYREVFRGVCAELGIEYEEPVFDHLLREHHEREGKPRLACYPRDLLRQLRDFAIYEGGVPKLTRENVDRAWHNYFLSE